MVDFLRVFRCLIRLKWAATVFALFAGVNIAQAQVFQWATPIQPNTLPYQNQAHIDPKIAVTDSGFSYQTGYFLNQLKFGTNTISAAGHNLYVARLDPAGNLTWLKNFPLINADVSHTNLIDIKADSIGNCFVAGNVMGSLNLNGTQLNSSPGRKNLFLAKLTPNGDLLWVHQDASEAGSQVYSIDLDGAANVYLTAHSYHNFIGTSFSFNGAGITGLESSIFMKVNSSGQFLWGKRFSEAETRVAVNETGNGVLYGHFGSYWTPSLDLGNGVVIPSYVATPDFTNFIAGFSASGQINWGFPVTGLHVRLRDMAADSDNNFYATGVYSYSAILNDTTLQGTPNFSNFFLLKISSSGNRIWAKQAVTLNPQNPNWYFPKLTVDQENNPIIASDNLGTTLLGASHYNYSLDPGYPLRPDVFLAKYSATTGNVIWSQTIGGQNSEYITGIDCDPAGNLIATGLTDFPIYPNSTVQFGAQQSINFFLPNDQTGVFISKLLINANKIEGKVFLDMNSSGLQDSTEAGFGNLPLVVQPLQLNFLSRPNGQYFAFTETGNFEITSPQVPAYYSLSPAIHTATFSGFNQTDSLNHFALQPIATVHDLETSIVEIGPPRPGFTYQTRITYRNVGTIPVSGTVQFTADTLLTFLNTTPALTFQTGDTLNWNFTDLQPYETRQIDVQWQVPATAALGTQLNLVATSHPIAADPTPANNSFGLKTFIVGSFDPNDKLVSHAQLSPAQVTGQQPLTYTIRFQNTGTDTAFAVMVRDELSELVDLATLDVLSASHPFTAEITGPHTIQWKFANILLPDSNTNEAASHGYIQYRIKPLNTLSVGQHITTSAGIYFDFNAPVLTNTTDTEVVQVNGLASDTQSGNLQLNPNPTTGNLTVLLQSPGPGQVQVRLYNTLGQLVHIAGGTSFTGHYLKQLNLSALQPGVYLVHVVKDGRIYSRKLIRQ